MGITFHIKEKNLDDVKAIIKKIGEIYDNNQTASTNWRIQLEN